MNGLNKIVKGDKVIWIVALLLGITSLIVVYSATSALVFNKYGGSTGRLLMKHSGTLLVGYAMMFVAYKIDYRRFAKFAWFLLVPCLALLFYTLIFGRNINAANRAINLFGISFQPSEVAKIILITYLSRQLVIMGDSLRSFKQIAIKLVLPIVATAGLIFPENLSTAAILVLVCMVLLFIGRVRFIHLLAIMGIFVALVGFYLLFDAAKTEIGNRRAEKASIASIENGGEAIKYIPKQNRIKTWSNRLSAMGASRDEDFDPFDDHHYQQTYAKIAVATSSVFGKGPGKSEQRNFLPHPYSDFIYAIIVEEYGIVGAVIVLLLYVILFTRVIRIVIKRPLTFGAFMAFGLGFLIIVQATINMGVSIGLLPVTGQPLPFVSMGGTSMMATGFIIGMILSVTRNMDEETEQEQQAAEQADVNITENYNEASEYSDEREPESRD
ncbi:MAG: FtsW/RodA/SpoVE family cell cycle protein [Bacteroidales bacterium]|nr:FtsW/RodA/SpoVE family cell cycle protein [Bacteroidales bacterium]